MIAAVNTEFENKKKVFLAIQAKDKALTKQEIRDVVEKKFNVTLNTSVVVMSLVDLIREGVVDSENGFKNSDGSYEKVFFAT